MEQTTKVEIQQAKAQTNNLSQSRQDNRFSGRQKRQSEIEAEVRVDKQDAIQSAGRRDHMEYQEGMQRIESGLVENVLVAAQGYDYERYSGADVEAALACENLDEAGLKALLSPAAEPYLEEMARQAKQETFKHFGNAVTLFTPLYISNYCENHCVYCGFNCYNRIRRGKLNKGEMEREMEVIARTGLKELLILTGESRSASGVEYIGEAIQLASGYFSTIGIEVYPMNVDEYRYLRDCGADFVSVYQETYDPVKYEEMHKRGSKRSFPYRFYAQERALMGGMRGVAFGSLLGLSDFRKDAYAAAVHAGLLQKKYPHGEISFSFPRLRPYINKAENRFNDVYEKQLLQVMLAYRLFMPFAGLTISTRERAGFRDNVIGLAATKISAGVKVGVGGHEEEAKGDEQFEISDSRSVAQIRDMVKQRGLQPVFTDYIRV